MTRRLRIAILSAVAAVAVVGALLGAAFHAAQQVQPYYQHALAIDPATLQRGSRELECQATALYSDARQRGQWQALFTAEQINGWIATQLADNPDRELPSNIRDPRVAITKDAFTLGFRTSSGGLDTVVSVDASVFLTDEGAIAIRLMSVRAGALPLPVMRLADSLADACQKLTLPVRWTHQNGEPVALLQTHAESDSDQLRFFIDSIELGDSELYVAGHTEISPAEENQAATSDNDVGQPTQEVAIGDYELRLTPRHKQGALQIARRSAPHEKSDAPSNPTPPDTPAKD